MKQIFKAFFLLIASIAISCNKTDAVMLETNTAKLTAEDAKKEFAIILSKAVAANKDLRHFIKDEALQRFDRDNDVFYPYIKDKVVSEGLTFKEILSSYADTDRLELLEYVEPKLNILVPDWSWLGAFSINDWNPDDPNIAVGYETCLINKPIYADGELIGELGVNQFPAFPLLIVKSNERMVLTTVATKSSPAQYDFLDDTFNAALTLNTKAVQSQHYDIEIDGVPYIGNYMLPSQLNSYVLDAYDEFKDDVYAAHRDYVYYGMTYENTVGRRNHRISECIHKIRFRGLYDALDAIQEDGDFIEKHENVNGNIYNSELTIQQLRDLYYSDGSIELRFDVTIGNKNGAAFSLPLFVPATFSDMYAIVKADLEYKHKTLFSKEKYVYNVNTGYFHAKWMTVNLRLPSWDISTQSSVITIEVEEVDDGDTYNCVSNIENTFMQNFDFNYNSAKFGLGYGNTTTIKSGETVTTQRIDASDKLGATYVDYMDPIIVGEETRNGVAGYNVKTFHTGTVEMMIFPVFE